MTINFLSTGSPDEFPKSRSVIGIVDLKTGKINIKIELDRAKYFGEGIVFFKDKLFQLTYLNQLLTRSVGVICLSRYLQHLTLTGYKTLKQPNYL